MIDTHTHLYLPEFEADRGETVLRALDAGVEKLMLPNVDIDTIEPLHALNAQFPNDTIMAMGLHPTSVDADYRKSLDIVFSQFDSHVYHAIGEIGIDLYWDKTYRNQQMVVLEEQLKVAVDMNLPAIIHCREGLETIIDVFKNFKGELPQLIFHSFTGTPEDVKLIREYTDPYFGINGIVTFKKATIATTLPSIGIDRLLLETDSPYLAPVPNRGKRNESSYLSNICQSVASSLGISMQEADEITTRNAKKVFNI